MAPEIIRYNLLLICSLPIAVTMGFADFTPFIRMGRHYNSISVPIGNG